MMIHDITAKAGRYKARKRVGRGKYGARGKTSGRGAKGAGSRSGTSTRFQFEGGQMPFFRRIPKFGFTNAKFKQLFWIVNVGDVAKHPDFARGGDVNIDTLVKSGLVRDASRELKVLGGVAGGSGVSVKLNVTAARISATAKKLIEGAGGKANETGTRKDKVRGIDRASGDLTPKNLTKKLKEMRAKAAGTNAKAAKAEAAEAPAEPKAEGKGKKKG